MWMALVVGGRARPPGGHGFLPIVVLAIFNFMPVSAILPAYSEQRAILIIGVAIMVPITISTFQGLGLNPVPFVYLVTTAANSLPAASAGPAIAAG